MLDEFHRTLKAEEQRERGREDGKRRVNCLARDIAVMCLQRRFLRRFLPKYSGISHEVGE